MTKSPSDFDEQEGELTSIPMENAYPVLYRFMGQNIPEYAPERATEFSSGFDLRADVAENLTLAPGERAIIGTGIQFDIIDWLEGQVRPRSGLAAKHGITIVNSPGTIDADYIGEIKIILLNTGTEPFVVEPSMRIAQIVFVPVYTGNIAKSRVEFQQKEAARGSKGFGSTGLT